MGFDKKGFFGFLKIGGAVVFLILIAEFSSGAFSRLVFKNDYGFSLKNIEQKIEFLKSRRANNNNQINNSEKNQINNFRVITSKKADINFLVKNEKKAIGIDLDLMKLTTYENGVSVKEYNIVSKGRPGSSWETPTGEYKINFKEERHFSSIGKVWMPYSIQFYGNFFIHGWPYYSNGDPVSRGYSGGCVRLETSDAKEVFEFSENGMPIFVYDEDDKGNSSEFTFGALNSPVPEISAKSFLVADIKSGRVLLEKDAAVKMPVASLTKLMTATVASEVIFIERTVKINKEMVETYGDSGHLKIGEELSLNDLFYPLLMESSNDAAKAIALMSYDEKRFISLMNYKAAALGMENSFYTDSSGIDSENISTAEDLFLLTKYLFNKRLFLLKISAEPLKSLISKDGKYEHTFYNFNIFSGNKDFVGGKTGYTKEANQTMISIFNVPVNGNILPIAIIVLNSDNREEDTKSLLNWVKGMASNSSFIKLGFVGDIMLNRGVEQNINFYGGGDFNYPFLKISDDLKKYDILFGNLEGPVSDKGYNVGSKYSFRMDPKAIGALKFAGFDVVSVANNHIGDYTKEAMKDTFSRLTNTGILYAGGGFNENEAYGSKIIEKEGVKFAFLAFSQFGENYLEAIENNPGIAVIYENKIRESIARAKKEADIIVASFHFGEEYALEPNDYQIYISSLAADAGADLIIGHHPHTAQPVIKYNNSYIAYSLGNFVFDQNFSENTMRGLLFEAGINKNTKKIMNTRFLKIKINQNFQPYLFE